MSCFVLVLQAQHEPIITYREAFACAKETRRSFLSMPYISQAELIELLLRSSNLSSPPQANHVDRFPSSNITQPHPHAFQHVRSCVGIKPRFGKSRELLLNDNSIERSSHPVLLSTDPQLFQQSR